MIGSGAVGVDDKYTYPGSGGVLVNYLGIRDRAEFDAAVNDFVSLAWADVVVNPPTDLTMVGLIEIHRRLFGRVLPFAGQLRTVDVQAEGTGIAYCRPNYIAPALRELDSQLREQRFFAGLSADRFIHRLAGFWGELSAAHPFRDGNTRSQSAYVSLLAEQAGYPLSWGTVDVSRLCKARLAAVAGREEELVNVLSAMAEPSTSPASQTRAGASRVCLEFPQLRPHCGSPSNQQHDIEPPAEDSGLER